MPTWMTRRTSPARHQLRPSETVRGGCHGRTTQPAGQRSWTICFARRGAAESPRHTRRRALPRPDGKQSLHLDLRTLGERLSGLRCGVHGHIDSAPVPSCRTRSGSRADGSGGGRPTLARMEVEDPRVLRAFPLPETATKRQLAKRIAKAAGLTQPASRAAGGHLTELALQTAALDQDWESMVDLNSEAPNAVVAGDWARLATTISQSRA